MQVQDFVLGVKRKLGSRTDIDNDVPLWIRDAVLELTMSYDFAELQTTGPLVQFTQGVCRYDVGYFTNSDEVPTRITSWFRFNAGTPASIQDTSLNGMMLKFRTLPVVEQMAKTLAPPSKYSRINKKTLIVGPSPDQSYYSFQNYQVRHPFPKATKDNDAYLGSLLSEEILMPDDWKIIVEFWAARLGALEKRMLDVAQNYHQVLFGDPNFQKTSDLSKGTPGLIFHRVSQYERDAAQNERALQPVVVNSCSH